MLVLSNPKKGPWDPSAPRQPSASCGRLRGPGLDLRRLRKGLDPSPECFAALAEAYARNPTHIRLRLRCVRNVCALVTDAPPAERDVGSNPRGLMQQIQELQQRASVGGSSPQVPNRGGSPGGNEAVLGAHEIADEQEVPDLLGVRVDSDGPPPDDVEGEMGHPALVFFAELAWAVDARHPEHARS